MKTLNPKFTAPDWPFKRWSSAVAITWLNEHGVLHEAEGADGNEIKGADGEPIIIPHAIGDDTAEATERQMTDIIGTLIFLYGFPAEFYYTKKIPPKEGEVGPVCTEL